MAAATQSTIEIEMPKGYYYSPQCFKAQQMNSQFLHDLKARLDAQAAKYRRA